MFFFEASKNIQKNRIKLLEDEQQQEIKVLKVSIRENLGAERGVRVNCRLFVL